MKKKMILGSIGAVIVSLLMVSSATAVIMPKSNESPNSRNYYDNKIVLTDKKISDLEKALTYSQDSEISKLIQGIIDLLREKGKINNKDIREMIKTNHINVDEYYGPAIIKAHSGGGINWPMLRVFGLFTRFISSGVVLWYAENLYGHSPVDVSIKGKQINYKHTGLALCYMGIAGNVADWNWNPFFELYGISMSVFIS